MLEYSLFHQLPDWTQAEVLAQKGILLAQRQHQGYSISLFHLDTYFIEVWAKEGIRVTTSFRKTAKPLAILEPYLNNLSIRPFLEDDPLY